MAHVMRERERDEMIKFNEMADGRSCLNRADMEEMIFTLLARDICAADTVRYWCKLRVESGKNKWDDAQIKEALECARVMDEQRLSGKFTKAPFMDRR
jgi:hypothetical protein